MIRFLKSFCFFCLVGAAVLAVSGCDRQPPDAPSLIESQQAASTVLSGDAALRKAFLTRQSGLWAGSSATVEKVLPDDLSGAAHQRFIVRLKNGQTILIAHNIDVAPRIKDLQAGDLISFYGRYEYNEKGGVVHWTHYDPDHRLPGGWIEHSGVQYQ